MLRKAAEVRELDTDFNYLWKAAEADLREIDTDLGHLAEADRFSLTFLAPALSVALKTLF